jgi:ABC-type phosphate transport system substrate-binding protein
MMLVRFLLSLLLMCAFELRAEEATVQMIIHPPLRVIVNTRNEIPRLTRKEVSDIFLKKKLRWKDTTAIIPYDLRFDDPLREQFSRFIHQRSPFFIKNYWQQKIFGGYELPPFEKSRSEIATAVAGERGAIGYVPMNMPLPSTVRELEISK